ncbi:unnamed protein product [Prunus armeniaca]|uniref:Uncharacterized protein n=1 Tax=Prunus armeniaca TaxID=36596 RepID=A0A6J5TK89_PRUAR|nr:unnamed protein product [Prunus armeniaca]CAB4294934.1 unnamed protein product [Prunus armeniaca]
MVQEKSTVMVHLGGPLPTNTTHYHEKNCKPPDALHFHGCDNLKLSGLTHLNNARAHIAKAITTMCCLSSHHNST